MRIRRRRQRRESEEEVASDEWRADNNEEDGAETQRALRFAEEFMSKNRRTGFRFAGVGLGIPAVWVVYQMLANPSPWSPLSSLLSVIFVILCPPCLLTFPLIDVEIADRGSYVIWMVVAILNTGLYWGLGSAYLRMRRGRGSEGTS